MTTVLHKAQMKHSEAQRTGDARLYEEAASLYRKAFVFDKARSCEEAAERLYCPFCHQAIGHQSWCPRFPQGG